MPTAKRVLFSAVLSATTKNSTGPVQPQTCLEPERTTLHRSKAVHVRARRGCTVARLGYGLHRCLVLVQQRVPPTLICASKSQVRKHAKMCLQMCALSIATTPSWGAPLCSTKFIPMPCHANHREVSNPGIRMCCTACAPTTWSMKQSRVVLWRGSAGPPAVHDIDRPAFPVTTTPD